jgi:hypothetical protein
MPGLPQLDLRSDKAAFLLGSDLPLTWTAGRISGKTRAADSLMCSVSVISARITSIGQHGPRTKFFTFFFFFTKEESFGQNQIARTSYHK